MIRLYPKEDLRTGFGIFRRTWEWDDAYKVRTTAERSINHIMDSFCLVGRKPKTEKRSMQTCFSLEYPNSPGTSCGQDTSTSIHLQLEAVSCIGLTTSHKGLSTVPFIRVIISCFSMVLPLRQPVNPRNLALAGFLSYTPFNILTTDTLFLHPNFCVPLYYPGDIIHDFFGDHKNLQALIFRL